MSIRRSLLRSSMLVVVVAVVLAAAGLWYSFLELVNLARSAMAFGDAGILSLMVERSTPGSASAYAVRLRPEFFAGRFEGPRADSYFQVWDARGESLIRSGSLAGRDLPRPVILEDSTGVWSSPPDEARRVAPPRTDNQDLEITPTVLPDGRSGTMCWIRFNPMQGPVLPPRDEPNEFVVIAVARSNSAEWHLLGIVASILVSGSLVVIGVFRVLIGVLIRRGLRPLSTLTDRVAAIDLGQVEDQRVSEAGLSDETRPAAAALNALLVKTSRLIERERRFSDSVAHELRTPLTEVRATAEVALRGGADGMREALQSVSEASTQMSGVLETLLRLSRRRAAAEEHPPVELEVGALVRTVMAPRDAELSVRGVRVDLSALPPTRVLTDATALKTIIDNLLVNAVEYTGDGGLIRVEAVGGAEHTTLVIENGPTALVPADIPRLFEPFWRKDRSRDQGQHAGLGLAITHALCESLEITIEPQLEGSRLRMVLRLPNAEIRRGSPEPAPAARP